MVGLKYLEAQNPLYTVNDEGTDLTGDNIEIVNHRTRYKCVLEVELPVHYIWSVCTVCWLAHKP